MRSGLSEHFPVTVRPAVVLPDVMVQRVEIELLDKPWRPASSLPWDADRDWRAARVVAVGEAEILPVDVVFTELLALRDPPDENLWVGYERPTGYRQVIDRRRRPAFESVDPTIEEEQVAFLTRFGTSLQHWDVWPDAIDESRQPTYPLDLMLANVYELRDAASVIRDLVLGNGVDEDRAAAGFRRIRTLVQTDLVDVGFAGELSQSLDGTLGHALAVQLWNYIVEQRAFVRCENENCQRWFTKQRGNPSTARARTGVRFCSVQCGTATRVRRTRAKQRAEAAKKSTSKKGKRS